jgi:hypothetical protein
MFMKGGRRFAPVCRIVLGDEDDGSVLMDKPVLITGLLHLADDLVNAEEFNIGRASELTDVVMDVPGGQAHVLGLITDLEGRLNRIRALVGANSLFGEVKDDEQKA